MPEAEDHGKVEINREECKGCRLCIEACPPKCLALSADLNHEGFHPAEYVGKGCTGCGICFYCCPECSAITVFKLVTAPPVKETTATVEAR